MPLPSIEEFPFGVESEGNRLVRLLGLGDNVVDKYIYQNIMYPGGNAVNVAVYSTFLGAEAGYLGIYGNDREGGVVRKALEEKGLDQSRCRILEGENGCSVVDLVDGDRTYIGGNDGGVSKTHPLVLEQDDIAYMKRFDLIHTSCYSHVDGQLPVMKTAGVPISYDFSNHFGKEACERVCPFIDVALISCGHLKDEEIDKTAAMAQHAGCSMVLTSMGSRGAQLYFRGKIYRQKALLVQAKDTLGAGDAFFTGFIVSYLSGGGRFTRNEETDGLIERSLYQAAEFAAKICSADGAFGCGVPITEG